MTNKQIDWNVIELTELYEAFDMVLRLLDEDYERARRIVDEAIKHGATPESMTKPIENFAMELRTYCERIERTYAIENKTQNS